MTQLTAEEKQNIARVAKDEFGGDTELAAAAHVHTIGTVKRVGSQMASWFAHEAIKEVKKQVDAFISGKKRPAKKAAAKRTTKK